MIIKDVGSLDISWVCKELLIVSWKIFKNVSSALLNLRNLSRFIKSKYNINNEYCLLQYHSYHLDEKSFTWIDFRYTRDAIDQCHSLYLNLNGQHNSPLSSNPLEHLEHLSILIPELNSNILYFFQTLPSFMVKLKTLKLKLFAKLIFSSTYLLEFIENSLKKCPTLECISINYVGNIIVDSLYNLITGIQEQKKNTKFAFSLEPYHFDDDLIDEKLNAILFNVTKLTLIPSLTNVIPVYQLTHIQSLKIISTSISQGVVKSQFIITLFEISNTLEHVSFSLLDIAHVHDILKSPKFQKNSTLKSLKFKIFRKLTKYSENSICVQLNYLFSLINANKSVLIVQCLDTNNNSPFELIQDPKLKIQTGKFYFINSNKKVLNRAIKHV
ncbi:hypothetical protein DLAC_11676 [Tieghemostelium lacteum]|uniref:Uncharacterized protein n=1 Tax=Tieghemostelium lacteum TaxID=361077 RepID=A0A151ZDY6_TIELA|nr:hypothetical protein DLAC_11676 [Tieghemostelium lacteum]|eukprot:KYQ92168.1 hypothetical protein DLAC_11676 [Tieghemostelium lacteum]